MPFAANSFDYVICMAAFKNFTEPLAAIDEFHRVLRPGGTASIFDLRGDATPSDIEGEVGRMQLSVVNRLLTSCIVRYGLLPRAYTAAQMRQLAEKSRFGHCEIVASGIGFEVRFAKS